MSEIFRSVRSFCISFRWRGLFFWTLFSLLVAIFSGVLVSWSGGVKPGIVVYSAVAASMAGILAFWAFLFWARASWVQANFLPFYDSLTRGHFVTAVCVSLLVVVFVVCLPTVFGSGSLGRTIFENPGGLFTIITGVFTLAGVYITLQSLLEMRQTITTFEQLSRRLRWMIETTVAEDDCMHCLVCTPAIGSLSLPKREWDKLYNAFSGAHTHIEMICLERQDLKNYHNMFLGRKTDRGLVTFEMIEEADRRADTLLGLFERAGCCKPTERPENKMPSYYMFANRQRAIIVAPFFMPMPGHGLTAGQIQQLPSVQMFGFETSDAVIVGAVHGMLKLYSEESRAYQGRGSDEVDRQVRVPVTEAST